MTTTTPHVRKKSPQTHYDNNMEANIKLGGNTTIKVTGETPVDIIKAISQFSQLPTQCGHCDSKDIAFRHRTAGNANEYNYLTLHCNSCGAALDIGQQKVGGGIFPTFFPKDANKADKVNVKNGFYKWKEQPQAQNSNSSYSAPQQQQAPPAASFDDDEDIPF